MLLKYVVLPLLMLMQLATKVFGNVFGGLRRPESNFADFRNASLTFYYSDGAFEDDEFI